MPPKSAISAYDLLSHGGRAGEGAAPAVEGVVAQTAPPGPTNTLAQSPANTPAKTLAKTPAKTATKTRAHAQARLTAAAAKTAASGGKMPASKRQPRNDEWTRAKMVEFLRELAACQSVARAAKAVGMSRQSAYRLRNRLEGTPFSLGWEVALEAGLQQLAHAVMDRAVNGVEMPVYYHGEVVGTRRQFDERLSIWVLENPWKVGRHQVAREYSGGALDALLERIEWGGFDWEDGDPVPGPGAPAGTPDDVAKDYEKQFLHERSWYASQVEAEDRRRRR